MTSHKPIAGALRFIFTRDNSVRSRLIQWAEDGRFSDVHVALDGAGTAWGVHPVDGVTLAWVNGLRDDFPDRLELVLSVPDTATADAFAHSFQSAPYDRWRLLEVVMRRAVGYAPHLGSSKAFWPDDLAIYMALASGVSVPKTDGRKTLCGIDGALRALMSCGAKPDQVG